MKMNFTKNGLHKGFTLIELLVVISIIALLSSVVLSSLNTARAKSADTAIKADLKQVGTQAQNYLDAGNASLGTALTNCNSGFFNDARFNTMEAHILANAAATPNLACATDTTGTKWAISVNLRGGGTWCADNSTGWFKPGTAQTAGAAQGTCL